jgi:hypothetical protein
MTWSTRLMSDGLGDVKGPFRNASKDAAVLETPSA